jgi:hypothetical protein
MIDERFQPVSFAHPVPALPSRLTAREIVLPTTFLPDTLGSCAMRNTRLPSHTRTLPIQDQRNRRSLLLDNGVE